MAKEIGYNASSSLWDIYRLNVIETYKPESVRPYKIRVVHPRYQTLIWPIGH